MITMEILDNFAFVQCNGKAPNICENPNVLEKLIKNITDQIMKSMLNRISNLAFKVVYLCFIYTICIIYYIVLRAYFSE